MHPRSTRQSTRFFLHTRSTREYTHFFFTHVVHVTALIFSFTRVVDVSAHIFFHTHITRQCTHFFLYTRSTRQCTHFFLHTRNTRQCTHFFLHTRSRNQCTLSHTKYTSLSSLFFTQIVQVSTLILFTHVGQTNVSLVTGMRGTTTYTYPSSYTWGMSVPLPFFTHMGYVSAIAFFHTRGTNRCQRGNRNDRYHSVH